MQRDALAAIAVVMVMFIAAVAVILSVLSPQPVQAAITTVTTDKDLYHSNEVMKITIAINASPALPDNTTIRIEGIKDRFGKMRLSREMPANITASQAIYTYDYKLPACSSCTGLTAGTYEINVTLNRNGAILSAMNRSVELKQ